MTDTNKKHISYSAMKIFDECPNKYKLRYVDGHKGFEGNEFTIFGTALHEACELKIQDEAQDEILIFENKFKEEYDKLPIKNPDIKFDTFNEQGKKLAPLIIPALKEHFGDFKFVSAEDEIYAQLDVSDNFMFKGYVDLIIQTSDGIYHIIDYKTTSWGWDSRKRNDPMMGYQLAFYKHFFSKLKGIPLSEINTHFVLLKRTARTKQIEVVTTSCTQRKISNAFKILNNCVINVEKNNFPKNKLSCENCSYYKKECI